MRPCVTTSLRGKGEVQTGEEAKGRGRETGPGPKERGRKAGTERAEALGVQRAEG